MPKNPSGASRDAVVDDRSASAGNDPADVLTAISRTRCDSDTEGIEALRKEGGDVVNAVMYLTEASRERGRWETVTESAAGCSISTAVQGKRNYVTESGHTRTQINEQQIELLTTRRFSGMPVVWSDATRNKIS